MISLPSIAVLITGVFLLVLLMNLVRKNTTLLSLYTAQSVLTAGALIMLANAEHATGLFYAAILTLLVKAIMAPAFLSRMIRKYSAHFSAASYLNIPLSLLALAFVTLFAFSFVAPYIPTGDATIVSLLIASIFATLFLMANRRGALGQIVGILALENAVVLVAAFLGLSHSLALELAIAFDIAVWIAIAAVFLAMLYRQFGVADADSKILTHLTEE